LRERHENAVAEAILSRRFHRLLESAPDAILEVDDRGRIVMVNAETERLFRTPRESLIGQPIEILLPPRFRAQHTNHRDTYAAHRITRPMGTGLDLYALRSDGTEFAVDINLSPVEAENGSHTICIVRDTSERKRTEEQIKTLNQSLERGSNELAAANRELEVRNREAERANRLKSEFVASMSHELRTPLNTIIGFSDLLAEQLPRGAGDVNPLVQKQQRYINHIRQGAHHLLELINDILDLSKIEAGRLELRREEFSMRGAMTEVLASIWTLASVKSIQVDNHSQGDARLFADRLRFKEILYNLLSNAVKFTADGGRVWVDVEPQPESVTISVSDTGIGIPEEEHANIFESFHQVAATTRGVREGTGLGLAITKRLIEMHGGRLWLESKPGAGSRFSFNLPLYRERPSSPGAPLIMIVEDDPSSQELLADHLESEGYRTVTVNSGADAVRMARELRPDLITLDMLMPGKTGWESMHELKNHQSTAAIPIIIVSVVDDRQIGMAMGAAEYLIKPIARETLIQAIRRQIKEHNPR
jgi:PAS domain S-box-containing protein